MREQFEDRSGKLKLLLGSTRKVTICLDGWSKKGLSSSFLGISACFFNTETHKPVHAFLNLSEIYHPHTGQMLANCLENSLKAWGIPDEKVLLVVSDNGSNMIKAIRIVQLEHTKAAEVSNSAGEEVEEEEEVEEGTEDLEGGVGLGEEGEELILPPSVLFRRMPCLAHTLQLIIKPVYLHYDTLLTKTRKLVSRLRKSSVAIELLVAKCGKSVITDCTTRWNSTHQMVKRLLLIKTSVNEVLNEIGKTYVFEKINFIVA